MKRIALSLALMTIFAATPLQAQNNQALSVSLSNEALGIAPGDTLLTITTEGKSTRSPDIVNFSAGITTIGKTASAAMAVNAQTMTRVIGELKSAGVAERDVQTSNLNLSPTFDNTTQRDGEHPRITGYQASNNVAVHARDISQAGRIIDALVSAGANEVSGPNFDLDHPEAALDEARTAAITSARSHADLYARAAGLKVARILSISENAPSQEPMMMARMATMDLAKPTPIAAGEVGVNVNITVKFELAPQ